MHNLDSHNFEGGGGGILPLDRSIMDMVISIGTPTYLNDVLIIAKLSPNFSFSWAEKVFSLDLPHPPGESIRMAKLS